MTSPARNHSDSQRKGPNSRNTLSSVANAMRVLKAFTSSQTTWGITALAGHLEISKSSTHRIVRTMAEEGLLDQDPDTGQYRLGLTMFDLAAAVPSHRGLHEAVLLPMTELRYRTGETVQVGVLDGRQVVYVERLDSPNTLRMFTDLGRRTDAHCTGSGKALLAFAPKSRREQILDGWSLPRKTQHTITSVQELRRELARIRRRGFSENRHESEIGVVSVAAPIRDSSGNCIAALSVAGPADRMDQTHDATTEAVAVLARTTSKRLGWSG